MGACGSKKEGGTGAAAGAKSNAAGEKAPKPERKKLDPADYMISKKVGEAIVRSPGSIDGQQFNIEECKDCDIFLMDAIATAFIDECENCRIFVGPTESSVFLRNCTSCDVMIACQQFRSRDCKDCRMALLCTTEPIIETSSNMQFACFDFNYFSLNQQLQRVKLKLWNNKWWQVYDFNKNPDKSNWSLFPQEEVTSMLRPQATGGAINEEELKMDRLVPVTLGGRQWPSQESCFVLFLPGADEFISAMIGKVESTEGLTLARGRSSILLEERLKTLFGWTKEAKLPSQCKGQEITGLQICGAKVAEQVRAALTNTGLATGAKKIRVVPDAEAEDLAKAFFEMWKDEV